MAFLKSNPEKALERDLAAATGANDKIAARLAEAELAVADLRMKAERLALDGADDAALDAAEAKTRAMTDRVTTLRAALAQSEARVADLRRERAEQADKKLRGETAAATELLAREMLDAATAFDAAAAVLADCTSRAAPTIYEATGLQKFAAICRAEVPAAADLVAKLLRSHAVGVLDGSAPATLRQPEGPLEKVTWPPAVEEKQESTFKYEVVGRGPVYRLPVPREAGQ
jgi:hypothetical protein